MIYCYYDKNIKANNIREFVSGLPSTKGIVLAEHPEDDIPFPSDATMIVTHGVLRGMGTVIKQAIERGVPWAYMDNGYFSKYKRVILNATAPITMREGRRFEIQHGPLKWRGGTGKNILILPPSPPYMDTFGARDFLNFCAHNINKYTDKNLVVRAKPAKGKLARPWDEQLKDAYCVVTWGSALALDAMNKGVPTISLGWCPAKGASFNLEDLETDKLTQEPNREAVLNNLTWSSFEREELPQAWDVMMENAKCQPI